jgi:acyl carrier protein
LITGGLGLIGLALCEYLAQTLQARLVLTSRSAFPPEREWEQWLATHDAEDEVSRKIRRLKSVEGMGGEVMVMRADVSKEEEMRSVIEEAGRRYGGINGVIHAAGIVGDASIRSVSETDESDYERQLSPKIHGLYVLEKLLSEQDLDFCFLLSSLSCILGGLGFTAYTAVNLFMDAFAHKRNRASKFPWISVDWDGWRFNQVAGDGAEGRGTWAQMGLTPGEGMQVFERVLAMERVGQVIISTGDLQSRIEQWVTLESVREKKTEEKKSSLSLHARPNLQNPYVPPRNDIEEKLTAIWQDLLGVAEIGVYDSFFDLGGHSLIVVQLISRLREVFNVEAPLRRVFEAPTVAQLSLVIINEQLGPAISEQDLLGPLSEIEQLSDGDLQRLLSE